MCQRAHLAVLLAPLSHGGRRRCAWQRRVRRTEVGTEVGGLDCVEMGPGEQRRASGEARESRIVETPPTLAQAALAEQGGVEKERLRQARGRGLGGRDVVMWPGAPTDLGP